MNKKLLLKVALPALCLAFVAMSCDDDDDKVISANELPETSQDFISEYYPNETVARAEEDSKYGDKIYEAELSDGTDIDFNTAGEWIEVEAPDNKTVSEDFLMAEVPGIYEYVDANYTSGIESVEYRDGYGYEVELIDDLEILFDENQNYLSSSYGDLDITDSPATLPDAAQVFIEATYPEATVIKSFKDTDDNMVEYEVTLSNGVYIEFDSEGNWDDIDAEHADAGVYVPATVLPEATQAYLSDLHPDAYIIEVEIEATNYEVELSTMVGKDLVFDANGEYVRTDS